MTAGQRWSFMMRYRCGATATASSSNAASHLPYICPEHGDSCRGKRLTEAEKDGTEQTPHDQEAG